MAKIKGATLEGETDIMDVKIDIPKKVKSNPLREAAEALEVVLRGRGIDAKLPAAQEMFGKVFDDFSKLSKDKIVVEVGGKKNKLDVELMCNIGRTVELADRKQLRGLFARKIRRECVNGQG